MKIELYEEMNEKIADILAIEKDPSSLYASAYIKDLRAENARLRTECDDKERYTIELYNRARNAESELKTAKQQAVREFAEELKDGITEMCMEEDSLYAEAFNVTLVDIHSFIDELINEFYGGEEIK